MIQKWPLFMLERLHRGYFTSGSANRYLTGRFKYETNFLKSIIKLPSKLFLIILTSILPRLRLFLQALNSSGWTSGGSKSSEVFLTSESYPMTQSCGCYHRFWPLLTNNIAPFKSGFLLWLHFIKDLFGYILFRIFKILKKM